MLFCILTAILFVLCFPDTSVGRRAREVFVEAPARWLEEITPGKVIGLIVFAVAVAAFSTVFTADVAVIFAGDIAAYALAVVVSRVKITMVVRQVLVMVRRGVRAARRTRARRVRRVRLPSRQQTGDDEGAEWALA